MAIDTLRALLGAVDHVLVVGALPYDESPASGPPPNVEQVAEPESPGLNAALTHGAALLRQRGFAVVLACVGDLPALRVESVRRVLIAARVHRRSYVADATGGGTTMLVARDTELQPRFGGSSAAAHQASGARPLVAPDLGPVPDARTDVDTEEDLIAAGRLGLGPATRAVLDRLSSSLRTR
jgi:2-phospho-L-lactate/phosphoenolpyruvate guanylyltransferase